ncbi:protein rep [Salmonella enterica subsp. enterica serovar Kentucky]|nr:protein rep [Salmonella enterica subsp. enterica serovar Kentucky]
MLSGRDYVKQYRWVELWRDCLRVDYDPNVDVRAVKPRKPKNQQRR